MKKRFRYLRAWWRDTRLLVREFRLTLLIFLVIMLVGELLLPRFYVHHEQGPIQPAEALYVTLALIAFQSPVPFPETLLPQLFFIFVPLIGLSAVLEGVVRFTTAFLHRVEQKESWQMALASTYNNHVIVCGLGRVGFRVVQQLHDLGEDVVVLERRADCRFVEQARAMKIPVIIGDARERFWLDQTGVDRATALIACTEDDLTNLDVALEARRRNPEIKVVMRMFDAELAENIRSGFNLSAAYSTSALSAPFFVSAATQRVIEQSVMAGETMVCVSRLTVNEKSPLVGMTAAALESRAGARLLFVQARGGEVVWNPGAELILQPGMRIALAGPQEAGQRLAALQKPKGRWNPLRWFGKGG